ncbi:DEAD/DEAH box helicase [Nocardioides sp. R-C-SC26]|uniref:DEAD/DEAH box helicase n=1 Tax=Nocardioides sp. R-C-SC26 TaxID=2870414 RepID=UPI0027E06835|nr:DEAD/DEAH box helicase [Nocardioides sp. R-C-SC26]
MGLVPMTGLVTLRAADPPRESLVVFRDARREVELPIKAALPYLTKARGREDADVSLRLLSGAALLAMRLVAAGRLHPAADGDSWRAGPLDATDLDRVARLAEGCRGDLDEGAANQVVRQMLDAVADAMPRAAPSATRRGHLATAGPGGTTSSDRAGADSDRFARRLAERVRRAREDDAAARAADGPGASGIPPLPHLVRIALRVEADEEELLGGSVRVVVQVHDEADAMHVCDAAVLFTAGEEAHGFGERARVHASLALRAAAEAWPPLERLLELRVPDQITLDTDEIVSLLDLGVAALDARGVLVHWPRALGRDLLASTAVLDALGPGDGTLPRRAAGDPIHREEPLQDPILGTEALFSFRWQIALAGDPLTPEEMDELARAAAPILKLRGNWVVVPPAVARRAKKRLIRTVKPAQAVAAALTGHVDLGTQGDPGGDGDPAAVVVGASLLPVRGRLLAAASREPVPPPAALQATLRDYQRHGLTWLADLTDLGLGACLADDMGLGKTLTTIALHLHRREVGHTGPMLVVCPASLLGNWEAELRRFAPDVEVRRHHASSRDLDDAVAGSWTGVVLTTYGTMRNDHVELAQVPWDLVVADEAQHIKNPATSVAAALRKIPSRARVALTGTPVENALTELWAILDWATPGLLGSRNAFRKAWAQPIESGADPAVARRFADLIGPFVLRRRKSDPGIAPELPPKTETDHPLALTREQTVLYEAFVRDCMERIERADEDSRRGLVLAMLTGLKQICNHPAQFLKQGATSSGVRLRGRSEKLDLLDELVTTAVVEGGAVLVFTQYVEMARLVQTHLGSSGAAHQLLHGGTAVAERQRMVERFQRGDVPVFLLSLKAGGTGLNLTRADHVVHLDRWWNPAVEDQATDRAYRIGQTRPVQVHRMIMRGTIEERIGDLLTRKRAIADAVLGRGDAALTELSNDELRDLVTLRREEP